MSEYNGLLISTMTFLPLAGGLLVLAAPRQRASLHRWIALVTSLGALAVAMVIWGRFDRSSAGIQFEECFPWIRPVNVFYHVGIDGLSMTMVLLTAVITPLCILASWSISANTRLYMFLFLLLQVGMFGVFTALNFIHFFVFWEMGLVPMFFLIKLWGGERRDYAAFKFFIYTMAGSVAMLLVFQFLYLATGTWDFIELAGIAGGDDGLAGPLRDLVERLGIRLPLATCAGLGFAGVALAFAIKVPIWPFHTWLPDAHTEAPTAGSIILAGVLLKMGVYGFLRAALPLFPDVAARFAMPLALLALASIILGAFAAMRQQDVKRMIAYSSVNHMGYCMLGIFAAAHAAAGPGFDGARADALNGAILQMFNHGITAGALFFLVGVIYDRAHTRSLLDFGGLRRVMPVYAGIMGIAAFSSIGLPGLNGFISEFLIFKGAFPILTPIVAAATLGLVITAVYLLAMLDKLFHGPVNERWAELPDMGRREILIAAPFLTYIFLVGVWPRPLLDVSNPAVLALIRLFNP